MPQNHVILPRALQLCLVLALAWPGLTSATTETDDPSTAALGAETPGLDARLHEILLSSGIRPALREDLQRPIDGRLLRIEAQGIAGSGLFRGKKYTARNGAEVEALSMHLKPGDQLILIGNEWKDTRFTFGGQGTVDAPIFVGAEAPGTVTFTGTSRLGFYGRNLVIMNLDLRNGTITEKDTDVILLGDRKDRLAENCILSHITMDGIKSAQQADWAKVLAHYVQVNGPDNTIARCTFAHLMNYGELISTMDQPSTTRPQRLHILNNRFIDRPKVDDDPCPYRYKIIQIGWSGMKAAAAGSLIQDNYFEDCASHVELISIKVSDVFLRNNRFIRCLGAVNIRMGDRALIQDNVFDGQGKEGTGGLRVAGADNVIIGNVFTHLHPAEFSAMWPAPKPPTRYLEWTFSLVAADSETSGFSGDAYGRPRDTLISYNRFENNTGRMVMGAVTPSLSPVHLLPRNIRIEHNRFSGDRKGDAIFDYLAPDPSGALPLEIFTFDNQFAP